MRIYAALLFTFGIGLAAGCEDTVPTRPVDLPGIEDMASGPDMAHTDMSGPIEFEDFVLGLINTQTSNTSFPTTTEDKIFVDSMDPTKFNALFP
jgi:hypothetical protein